ncbi:MAG: endonuclease/exonuclease/phosphatase family metal-dependent hydrolase [Bacteroidia bacterium]|jgi:endonuclease/exonuclease/phosphatase family metal-dependent hydrolase
MRYLVLIPLLFCTLFGHAQNRILVDGEFKDWAKHPTTYTDAAGDGGSSGIDFGKAQIFNDADYIFFYVETGTEINLQDLNDVVIYIDIDNNTSTGTSKNGIGADLSYTFGDRSGSYHTSSNSSVSIRHRDIGLITAPTVTSDRFEIGIKRVFSINGILKKMGDSVKVVFMDNASNGDVLPSNNGGVSYTFSTTNLEPLPSFSLQKPTMSNLRIMSYNVERDGLFEASRVPAYTRVFQALQPDIIGFQEVYNHSSLQIADLIETMLPSAAGAQWYHAMAKPDCHVVSKYPILKSAQIPGVNGSGNGAFLIDIPNSKTEMLLIVAHPPCCTNNSGRQTEVDRIMEFVRKSKNGKGPIQLDTNAQIVILGDMNFVGDHNQLTTLLSGDIFDETSYGSDFTPDWDGSNLLDAKPPTTGVPFSFSWYSESSSFSPGRLDYVLYSGSNLTLENSYSLFTPGLAQDSLSKYTLLSNDVIIASDHLPLVADFTVKNNSTQSVLNTQRSLGYLEIYPNPASDVVGVSFINPQHGVVTMQLVDGAGSIISTLYNGDLVTGKNTLQFSAATYPSGTYIITVTSANSIYHRRISVVH